MNTAPFFRKWMQDMADGKMKNGVVPAVVPYAGLEMMYNNTGASVGWGDAAVILPYRFWKRYGDLQIMEEYYEKLAKPYVEFMLTHTGHAEKKEAQEIPCNTTAELFLPGGEQRTLVSGNYRFEEVEDGF